jgi:hypothetical protein
MGGMKTKMLMAALTAGSLALGLGLAQATTASSKTSGPSGSGAPQSEKKADIHRIRGEVTAVEPGANTMVVKAPEGKKELTVGVDVSDKTVIREGKAAKTLADIKVGDKVWMKYERANDKLVADFIRILKPASMTAKSKSY